MSVKKRMIIAVVSMLGLAILGGGIFLTLLYKKTDKVVQNAYHPVTSTKKEKDTDILSFLIMGLDNTEARNLGSSRTDAMMVATLNNKTKKITLVSLPRDSFVKIHSNDYQGMQRIEAAYTYGGPKASVDTVSKLLNIPINHYIVFNFNSFQKVIDELGGIDVQVPKDFEGPILDTGKKVQFKKGLQHLNGEEALAFSRERKIDNDIMRGLRQQIVLDAVKDKALELNSITKYLKIAEALDGEIQMDLTMKQMKEIIQGILKTKDYNTNSLTFDWRAFSNEGRSMVELYADSVVHVSHQLRASLGLEKEVEDDETFQTNGHYKYESDYSTATKEQEKAADTFRGENIYVGTPGNTKTGKLPNRKTETGFYD
ncbi:LCP family protein [Listeria fleischmannii]|uniref:LCP family protein n=1 Tax=Listeria fleischmannii TaxID=1069827 RepID=UPI000254F53A|nr:LCP family protein [Listeria fleischmannii]EIA19513.1 cell envelope-associated transcriptional attenuator [Listeria fleischmannii subsp. coloradonensis]STY33749.1 Putative transcriptional regulator yvhJ [Listeria fleischmannii subsp. coloradonensis]